MLTKDQMRQAMEEWLTTEGLNQAEINFIEELHNRAMIGEAPFRMTATFFAQAMPEVVISAVNKARSQGKCLSWSA